MSRSRIYLFVAIIIVLGVVALLITGSPLLTMALDEEKSIPLGTFITWAGMIAWPMSMYWGVKEFRAPSTRLNRVFAVVLKGVLLLGVLWVPISYLLAGNLSFSFSEKASFQGGQDAMQWFWVLSYGIGVGAVAILLIYWLSRLFVKK